MEQFDNNEIFDDFKPAEEQNSFINDAISNGNYSAPHSIR